MSPSSPPDRNRRLESLRSQAAFFSQDFAGPGPVGELLKMKRIVSAALLLIGLVPSAASAGSPHPIRLVKTDAAHVDIYAGETLFASYHYGIGLHKPILHPLLSPGGHRITRGFPMEFGIPGEQTDHWQHEGVFFTYRNVNGVDFWSKFPPTRDRPGSGRIRHTGFTGMEGGPQGILGTTSDWIAPTGQILLRQNSQMIIRAGPAWRTLDLQITLTAQEQPVTFGDIEEGLLAVRVASDLREDRTGRYLNAEGLELAENVWGKRSPWVALRGTIQDEDLTLAILNHPRSTRYPTYWHARAYGLFAANPFGRADFEKGAPPLNFSLNPGESATFLYRILIHSGHLTRSQLKNNFTNYRLESK